MKEHAQNCPLLQAQAQQILRSHQGVGLYLGDGYFINGCMAFDGYPKVQVFVDTMMEVVAVMVATLFSRIHPVLPGDLFLDHLYMHVVLWCCHVKLNLIHRLSWEIT